MFCTQCGTQLGDHDRFCSQCAHPTALGAPPRYTEARLTRDTENGQIAGVCAGVAKYLDIDVVLVRVLWIALTLAGGAGVIGYLAGWIIIPKERVPATVTVADAR
jgi:phage shock protein C